MHISLRSARTQDFEYCRRLYFAGMKRIIEELQLDMGAQEESFHQYWEATQVQIIVADNVQVGWVQSFVREDELFVGQLFVDEPFQRQGIGTEVMNRLIKEASDANRAISLAVLKINPAVRLYDRLGFHITHEDHRKFYMRRDPIASPKQP
jgi:GNAT superfamily N-acetyltransferase